MLGRGVAAELVEEPGTRLVSEELRNITNDEADLFVLNLECCISERGAPRRDPSKAFYFRAPPAATGVLRDLGVSCVTLANNHAMDFGEDALLDTIRYLDQAAIRHVGAGSDVAEAFAPAILEEGGSRLALFGITDHPADYAAGPGRPGVAFADLRREVPSRFIRSIGAAADLVLVSPHWGPNMNPEPLPYIRAAARSFIEAGATLVAGHSAHVFHGADRQVLYDLGDFLDDYAVDPELRNDLGLLFLVTLGASGPIRIEAVPLTLDHCYTRLARDEDAAWIARRFRAACRRLGTEVRREGDRLVVSWPREAARKESA